MVRTARRRSESGVYHAMARGINKQPIFEETADFERFQEVLLACKEVGGFSLFAYCLMTNHFHLLIKPSAEEPLETLFRRIGGRYVGWFNKKYGRTGHLFQGRFASEPVENDSYLLSCTRYIVQNPVAAGLCESPFDYRFSSAREYLEGKGALTDIDFVMSMLGCSDVRAFMSANPDWKHIDIDTVSQPTDVELKQSMQQICGCSSAAEFQRLEVSERNAAFSKLRRAGGSIRQISRLTGFGVGIVRKYQ